MLSRFVCAGAILALLGGCAATNPRFETETPTSHITGEKVCEVPQHWKALALEGVDMQSLTQAVTVQIRVPAEWVGDALGWFVEGDDRRTLEHVPRYTWQALVLDERTGKKRFFPAVMKNPLTSPYLTVVINGSVVTGQEIPVYVLSGARTRLLTTAGDRLRLPRDNDCLALVDAEFLRQFPSRAAAIQAPARLLAGIRADFPKPSLQSDGRVYSLSRLALNPRVVGDLRQVTPDERAAERGSTIAVSPVSPLPTLITGGVALVRYVANEERYTGPFGEREYSLPEAQAALGRMARDYNRQKRELEETIGVPYSGDLVLTLDFEGRKSGWEIGEMLALQIEAAWRVLDRLKERAQARRR